MRSFNPYRLFFYIDATVYYDPICSRNHFIILHIIIPYFYDTVSRVTLVCFCRSIIMYHVCLAIIIKEKRRINAFKLKFDRITPAILRILCLYHHISKATGKLSGYHIKRIIIGIISYSRSIYTCTNTAIFNL